MFLFCSCVLTFPYSSSPFQTVQERDKMSMDCRDTHDNQSVWIRQELPGLSGLYRSDGEFGNLCGKRSAWKHGKRMKEVRFQAQNLTMVRKGRRRPRVEASLQQYQATFSRVTWYAVWCNQKTTLAIKQVRL